MYVKCKLSFRLITINTYFLSPVNKAPSIVQFKRPTCNATYLLSRPLVLI